MIEAYDDDRGKEEVTEESARRGPPRARGRPDSETPAEAASGDDMRVQNLVNSFGYNGLSGTMFRPNWGGGGQRDSAFAN